MRTVICRTAGCGRVGIVGTVHDTAVAPGVITRPVLYCAECGCELCNAIEGMVVQPSEDERRQPPEAAVTWPPENRAVRRRP